MNELIEKLRSGKCSEVILRTDLVIPAGNVLRTAPRETRRVGSGHYSAVIGLSKDSYGDLTYSIDPSSEKDAERLINEWFIVI